MISANQVGFPDAKEHLTQILSSFNFTDILITLARINLFLQCSKDFSLTERILQKNFCSRYLRDEIDWRGLRGDFIFNRQSTLHLLSESVHVSDPYSTRSPDTTDDAKIELARCYLIANGSPNYESSDHETGSAEEKGKNYWLHQSRSQHILKILPNHAALKILWFDLRNSCVVFRRIPQNLISTRLFMKRLD